MRTVERRTQLALSEAEGSADAAPQVPNALVPPPPRTRVSGASLVGDFRLHIAGCRFLDHEAAQ